MGYAAFSSDLSEVSGSCSKESLQDLFMFVQMFILSLTGRRSQTEKYLSHLRQYVGCYYKKRCHRKLRAVKTEKNADPSTVPIPLQFNYFSTMTPLTSLHINPIK